MNQDQHPHLFQNKIAAVVEIQQLAERCRQYAEELKTKNQTISEQQQTLDQMAEEKNRWQAITELGRRELQQKKREALNRLRAIVHYSGDHHRLADLQERIDQEAFDPTEMERIHRTITQEFHTLYPAQAHSKDQLVSEFETQKPTNWSAFRLS